MKETYSCWCCFFWILFFAVVPATSAQEKPQAWATSDTDSVTGLIKEAMALRAAADPGQAMHSAHKALQLAIPQEDNGSMAEAMIVIALCYKDMGDYLKSKQLLYLAWPHCVKAASSSKHIMAYLYSQLGSIYGLLGDNDSSIYFLHEALGSLQHNRVQDSFFKLELLCNIGTSWLQNGELDKALYYHRKAEVLAKKLRDTLTLAIVYSNIGTVYRNQQDSVRAMHYLEASLKLYQLKRTKKVYPVQFLYYSMGTIQPTLAQAIPYYNKALAMDSHSVNAAAVYELIGKAYFDAGDYAKAEGYYKKSEELSERKRLEGHLLHIYPMLAAIYEKLKRYPQAYQYQSQFVALNDSLRTLEKNKMINQLDVKYKVAEKDRTLAENKARLYRQQQWLIAFTGGILLLASVLLGIYRGHHYKQKEQKVRMQNMEQQEKIGKLQAKMQGEEEERSRIARELHDGINVLLSATKMNYASLGKEYKGLPEAPSYGVVMGLLNEMGLELRTITYKLVPELLIQQSLPDAVETFCDLIRKSKELYIEFQSWGSFSSLPAEYCFAVYRVVQELVHNIIKHANATSVLIQLRHQDGILSLTVDDNGDGFNEKDTGIGLGLQSIRSRVESLGGQVIISSTAAEGTSVEVELQTIRPVV